MSLDPSTTGARLLERIYPVLILDDEADVAKSIARDLKKVCDTSVFTKPEEALRSFEVIEYSVVVSDLRMPSMDGIEFLARCAAMRADTQRILLTAFADLASLTAGINRAQINLLLTKPWEPDELRAGVDDAQRRFERLRENAQLRRMVLTDALTGISNHRYFWERLESELSRAERYKRPLSLLFCDIDNFKRYNDEHGHQVGDQVLRNVANVLDRTRRTMDTVARYGGEEFAVILPECPRSVAADIARRLLGSVAQETGIHLSGGVACFPEDATSSTQLVERADQALRQAKASGKNQVLTADQVKI